VWDFAESTLKPVAMHHHEGSKLSCVLFSPTSPVVMCGGDDGAVSVHRIHYTGGQVPGRSEQLRLMDEALRANVMKTEPNQMAHD
jgi:dynein intermediate chain 4, axonemal